MAEISGDQEFISDEVIGVMQEVSKKQYNILINFQAIKTCFGL